METETESDTPVIAGIPRQKKEKKKRRKIRKDPFTGLPIRRVKTVVGSDEVYPCVLETAPSVVQC